MNAPQRSLSPLRFVLAALTCWLLLALACNMPAATRTPRPISGQQLRQTLQALSTQAATTPGAGEQTAVPGAAQPPVPQVFPGLSTAIPPQASAAGQPTSGAPAPSGANGIEPAEFSYYVQSGDTLASLAKRFGVDPQQIRSSQSLPAEALLSPGQSLTIPNVLTNHPYHAALLPDSEVIYSPTSVDFDVRAYVAGAGGYLAAYQETLQAKWLTGADVILRVSQENAINPRLLLAFLEYRAGWVRGQLSPSQDKLHPLGYNAPNVRGLYMEMILAAKELNTAYYGWRQASLSSLTFADNTDRPPEPRTERRFGRPAISLRPLLF